jgi:hypothetical protein
MRMKVFRPTMSAETRAALRDRWQTAVAKA